MNFSTLITPPTPSSTPSSSPSSSTLSSSSPPTSPISPTSTLPTSTIPTSPPLTSTTNDESSSSSSSLFSTSDLHSQISSHPPSLPPLPPPLIYPSESSYSSSTSSSSTSSSYSSTYSSSSSSSSSSVPPVQNIPSIGSSRRSFFSRIRLDFGIPSLIPEWKDMLVRKTMMQDFIAGITVTCVALPLSLAIALASGVPPILGLVSAVVGGIAGAILGGTTLAVTGPAAAMSVLVATAVQNHGLTGLLFITMVCGVLQIVSGVFGIGRYAKLVPTPVIAGFLTGVGALILLGQLPKIFGIHVVTSNCSLFNQIGQLITSLPDLKVAPLAVCMSTYAIAVLLPKIWPKVPASIVAVASTTAFCWWFSVPVSVIGEIPSGFPAPVLPEIPSLQEIEALTGISLMIFALASIESLLSSATLDKIQKGKKNHDPDQELIGQGASNIGAALFGGIPCTGVIVRSLLNYQVGAKTRRAALFQSAGVLCSMLLFSSAMSQIPIPTLSAVLVGVSLKMLHPKEMISIARHSKLEMIPLFTTFGLMLGADLVVGIVIGSLSALALTLLKRGPRFCTLVQPSPDHISIHGPLNFLSIFVLDELGEKLRQMSHSPAPPPGEEYDENDLFADPPPLLTPQQFDLLGPISIDCSNITYIDYTGAEAFNTSVLSALDPAFDNKDDDDDDDPDPLLRPIRDIYILNLRDDCKRVLLNCDHSGLLSKIIKT